MALNLDTNVNVNTAEFDAKIKASAEKAKKNLSDISKGLRVAGPAVAAFGERLKNLTSVGFAGIMAAGVGVLIAGLQKAVSIADSLFKGALEDAKAMDEQLAVSMNRARKKIDEAEEAFKFLLEVKNRATGIEGLTREERLRLGDSFSILERNTEGDALKRIKRSADRGFQFKPEDEADILRQLIQKRIQTLDSEIIGKKSLAERYRRSASAAAAVKPFSRDAIELAREANNIQDQIMALMDQKKKLEDSLGRVWDQVAARHYDLQERGTYSDRQRITRMAKVYKEKAMEVPDKIAGIGQSVTRKPSGMSDQEYLKQLALAAKKIQRFVGDAKFFADTATGNAMMYKNNKPAQEQAKQAEFYKDNAEKIAKGILGSIKKQQLSILGEQRNELLNDAKNIRMQSQVFTNNLTRRGGFQTGGRLWSNDRYQQQMTARVQNISTQLQTLIRNINQLNTTP